MGVEGAGLAYLVSSTSRAGMDHASLPSVLSYVYETALEHVCDDEDIDYPQLVTGVQQHVTGIRSADSDKTSSSSGATASNGRLGPAVVAVDRASVCGSFSYSSDNLTIESLGNFSSCRANVAVYTGKWMYECTVLTPGIQQIGWATIHCPFTAEEGVGDAPDSYAVDGKRMRKWSVKPQPYGEPWVQGDVMGCCLDLDAGTLTFYRNGQSLGTAYDRVRTMQPSLAYFPAVSLSHTERCMLNFGAKPFMYPVVGYQPLQSPPSTAVSQEAAYYCSCFTRLCLIAAADGQDGLVFGQAGASTAAARANSTKVDDLAVGVAATDQPQPQAVTAAGALGGLGYSASGCSPRTPAAALGPPFSGSVSLSSADIVLLAAVVLEPLQQLLVSHPYLIHSALLPVLGDAQRENEPQTSRQLQLMMQLLVLVWHQEFNSIMFTVLEALAYRCQISPLLVQDFPYTAGYPHLALAVSLLQHPRIMRLFVLHPDFMSVLEGLLTRKSPSPKDLQTLLPHVWWKGCKDETASEERLRASISIITTTLAKVEQRQYDMLELLLATPFHDPATATTSTRRDDDDDCALLVFLRFLLQKNRGALRDVPPPGLSESTVLMTTFFGLLRLLQPALQAACESGTGPLAAFPVAELLAAADAAAEASPVFDAPRLGGVVSHLARENSLSDLEKQPISVGPVQPPSRVGSTPDNSSSKPYASTVQNQQGTQQGSRRQQQRYVAPPALKDAWVPELLNTCMLLYCWRVGFNYKMIHTLSSSVASSSATLEDLDRMIANSPGGDPARAGTWLIGTRKVYHDELTRDVRLLTLLRVAFFSPGKQAALCNLTTYLATLVTTVSSIPPAAKPDTPAAGSEAANGQPSAAEGQPQQQPQQDGLASPSGNGGSSGEPHLSNLLRYLPVVYVEVIVDYLTASRRCDEQSIVLPSAAAAGSDVAVQGPQAYVAWLCGSLNDRRIANPDVQESLLQVCGLLLDQPTWRSLVEAQPDKAWELVGSLLQVFDSRLWHPASGVLLKVIKDCGFGHQTAASRSPASLQQVLLDSLEGKSPIAAADNSSIAVSLALGGSAAAVARSDQDPAVVAARTKGFLNRLFNTLNWTLTEFTVCVGDLHNLRGRRSILEAQNQYRRTGLMFELSVNFMRILEFVVVRGTQQAREPAHVAVSASGACSMLLAWHGFTCTASICCDALVICTGPGSLCCWAVSWLAA
eukprot:GHUV01012839.1.p1 GENE.GHUV01012839.1~~GHUV01012839.1.p1  ORF type:complete len:1206 (+),score=405.87 GHUV01012839.1:233-3850(+)